MAKKNDPVEEPPAIETTENTPESEAEVAPAPLISPLGAPMSPAAAPEVLPETTLGFSYEYGVDVKILDTWQRIRFMSNVNPAFTPKEMDGATYEDQGSDHPVNVGETGQLDMFVQQHRLSDGKYLPEMEAILAAAKTPGASLPIRWYDKPAEGTPNPTEAYEATATFGVQRAQTGNAEIGGWNVTAKIQGKRKQIANPAAATGE